MNREGEKELEQFRKRSISKGGYIKKQIGRKKIGKIGRGIKKNLEREAY